MKQNIKPLLIASIALSSTLCSSIATADVVLEVPYDVTVLAANEQEPKLEGSFFADEKTLALPDGENQIVFKFEPSFKEDKDRQYVVSDTYIATFTAKNDTVVFDLPEYRDIQEAELKISDLQWSLKAENGKAVPLKKDKLIISGMQVGRDYTVEIEDYNQHQTGLAVWANPTLNKIQMATVSLAHTNAQNAKAESTVKAATQASAVSKVSDTNTVKEMLHFWYAKADEQTKLEFKQFILNQ